MDEGRMKENQALLGTAVPGAQERPPSTPTDDGRPLFWQHAISECNEAHAALDRLGAPKTRMVRRVRGEGDQEITLGLRDRIMSIPRRDVDGGQDKPSPAAPPSNAMSSSIARTIGGDYLPHDAPNKR
jgi:hypothetical protein